MYNLRHTRITEVSRFLSQMELCKFAGWRLGSGQFQVYVHLTSEDVNQAISQHYGLGVQAEKEPLICKVCGQKNEFERSECLRCRRPLSLEATYKTDQVKDALKVLADLQETGKLNELMKIVEALGAVVN